MFVNAAPITSEEGDLFAIEITADCPFVSAYTIDLICKTIDTNQEIDYMSNTITRCWPDGFDVQVYNLELLGAVNAILSADDKHREHGGWNIVNYSIELAIRLKYFPLMINHSPVTSKYFHPEWSVTLDTQEDYGVIRDIISVLGDNYDRRAIDIEVLMILMNTPEILGKNKSISRNIPGV